jgi:hypothetical protein
MNVCTYICVNVYLRFLVGLLKQYACTYVYKCEQCSTVTLIFGQTQAVYTVCVCVCVCVCVFVSVFVLIHPQMRLPIAGLGVSSSDMTRHVSIPTHRHTTAVMYTHESPRPTTGSSPARQLARPAGQGLPRFLVLKSHESDYLWCLRGVTLARYSHAGLQRWWSVSRMSIQRSACFTHRLVPRGDTGPGDESYKRYRIHVNGTKRANFALFSRKLLFLKVFWWCWLKNTRIILF